MSQPRPWDERQEATDDDGYLIEIGETEDGHVMITMGERRGMEMQIGMPDAYAVLTKADCRRFIEELRHLAR